MCVSKKLGNLWEELGNAMEGDDEIEIGEVDCGKSRDVCTKVEIHSYPTFKLFYNGEEVSKYQGKYFALHAPLVGYERLGFFFSNSLGNISYLDEPVFLLTYALSTAYLELHF